MLGDRSCGKEDMFKGFGGCVLCCSSGVFLSSVLCACLQQQVLATKCVTLIFPSPASQKINATGLEKNKPQMPKLIHFKASPSCEEGLTFPLKPHTPTQTEVVLTNSTDEYVA